MAKKLLKKTFKERTIQSGAYLKVGTLNILQDVAEANYMYLGEVIEALLETSPKWRELVDEAQFAKKNLKL
jgi:hypothetical protein